ncbi:MAG TPA: argininosuccinate lyase, partial [Pirellulales bacterium]
DTIDAGLASLQAAFVGRSDADRDCVLPGYTHTQRAQPVLAAHYWLAYVEKFQRDRERLSNCRRRANVLTLGSAALAGTSLPIDRQDVAARLDFEGIAANSLDASSDRDFVVEFAFALTMVAEHLSVWAEEWILWSTSEFGFIKLPQTFCTGSSIMPQKINPDVLELVRGKTGRVVGNLTRLLVLIKGLPLAYNRDLQEDKEAIFDSFDTVSACLNVAAPLVAGAELNRETIAAGLDRGYLDATTLMEWLILKHVPQRLAHEIVGRLVRRAMELRVSLADLPWEEFTAAHDGFDKSLFDVLGAERAVRAFKSYGSTAPAEVDRQIAAWKSRLATKT